MPVDLNTTYLRSVSPQAMAANDIAALQKEVERLRSAMSSACDLLAERTHGNPARSAAHNARLRLESALAN
jgi:hypothetical protein